MFLSWFFSLPFVFLFCSCRVLKLHSFNSQLHSALSVVGYYARGQEMEKYCPLPEPIRLQDSQDTARSRSKKEMIEINGIHIELRFITVIKLGSNRVQFGLHL